MDTLDSTIHNRLSAAAARTARTHEASLRLPTATSVRTIPAQLLVENRALANSCRPDAPVTMTELVGHAVGRALRDIPVLNQSYVTDGDGRPAAAVPGCVRLGILVDVQRRDGGRAIRVPMIPDADLLDFAGFAAQYRDVLGRARTGRLTVADTAGVTISLTNPGGLGTVHSVPRLMPGQGALIGFGAVDYPTEFRGTSARTLVMLGIGRVLTMTCTYDHRVIQGVESGAFLRRVERLLLGDDGFWDELFASLRLPVPPLRWERDNGPDAVSTPDARRAVAAFVSDRRARSLPEGLTLWDLDRLVPAGGRMLPLRELVHTQQER